MESVWSDTVKLKSFEPLNGNEKVDALIIGGGIAGLLTAYLLDKQGVNYLLVEKNRICSGVTENTTAKITYLHGLCYSQLLKSNGFEAAQGYLYANRDACKKFEELCRTIDCDYERKDNYVYSLTDKDKIQSETTTLNILGSKAVFCEKLPLPLNIKGAVRVEGQAQFNPLKFLAEISKDLNIREQTCVTHVEGNKAITSRGIIEAKQIIIATHFPIINTHGAYFLKMYQHRSYVLGLENAQQYDGMFVDESNTGLSFRNYKNLLLLGGGGHRTGKNGGGYELLREFAKEKYPQSDEIYHWATQDCMTLDGAPYIGHYSKSTQKLYVASGFNKWGMSGSMVAATILSDMVCGRRSEYEEAFNPSRSILKPQLLVNSFETITNLLRPTAPRCSHLGCALKWNKAEHSWDCACHGSRYSSDGEVIEAPAIKNILNKRKD